MSIAIADLDTSLNLNQTALVSIVGGERLVSSRIICRTGWRNSNRSRYFTKMKQTCFGKYKKYHYRQQNQTQKTVRRQTYLTGVSY